MTDQYRYGGARALVALHEERLRSFLGVWREAKAQGLTLPPTEDPDYLDLDHLVHHVIECAASYLTWCCEVLEIEDPGLPAVPPAAELAGVLDPLVEELLDGWRASPLRGVGQKEFYIPAFKSRWNVDYCVDAMLEHAVMHPVRHEHQMRRLLAEHAAGR